MNHISLLGVGLSCLLLLLIQDLYIYRPFDSYIYTIPVITYCVGKIVFLKPTSQFEEWGGLLCMVPAFGYTASKYAMALQDLSYLSWQQGVAHLLRTFYVSTEGFFLIFFCCSLCAWTIRSRMISSYFLMLSLLQGVVCFLLYTSVVELDHGSPHTANITIVVAELSRVFVLLGFVGVFFRFRKRFQVYPMILAFIIGIIFVCPPIVFQMSKLEVAKPLSNPPIGRSMYGAALSSANPKSSNFIQQLNNQGTTRYPNLGWWCNTTARYDWHSKTRATAILAMESEDTFGTLSPFIEEFFYRGITRLAFVGKSQDEIKWGPLKKHIQYPLARFYLDPVPQEAFWGIAENKIGVRWIDQEPTKQVDDGITPCGIWVDEDISVQTLFTISQTYGEPTGICSYGLFLVFGTPKVGEETAWRSPLSCQL
jgi:hypothetical protein